MQGITIYSRDAKRNDRLVSNELIVHLKKRREDIFAESVGKQATGDHPPIQWVYSWVELHRFPLQM